MGNFLQKKVHEMFQKTQRSQNGCSFSNSMIQDSTNLRSTSFIAIFGFQILGVYSQLFILPAVLANNPDTPSLVDNYILHNQRQYETDVRVLEMHLDNFREDYYNRIETIDYQVEQLELKLHKVDNRIKHLVLRDDVSEHCVLKYRSKIPHLEVLKTSLALCKQNAKDACEPIISLAEATQNRLKKYLTNQLVNHRNDCKKQFSNLDANYTTCMVAAINSINTIKTSDVKTFHNQLNHAKCSAALHVKQTFDCYATLVGNAYSSMGEVMGLVTNCNSGHEFCPSCYSTHTIPSGGCSYQLNRLLSENERTSAEINNPFKGLNKSTPCLHINFNTYSAT